MEIIRYGNENIEEKKGILESEKIEDFTLKTKSLLSKTSGDNTFLLQKRTAESQVAVEVKNVDRPLTIEITGSLSHKSETKNGKQATFDINPGEKYHLKLYDVNGNRICSRQFQTTKTISSSGGYLKVGPHSVSFPEGAFDGESQISISECDYDFNDLVGPVVDFKSTVSKFLKPVTCKVQLYDKIKGEVFVEYLDEKKWIRESVETVSNSDMLTFCPNHFTIFRFLSSLLNLPRPTECYIEVWYDKNNNNIELEVCPEPLHRNESTGRIRFPFYPPSTRIRRGEVLSIEIVIPDDLPYKSDMTFRGTRKQVVAIPLSTSSSYHGIKRLSAKILQTNADKKTECLYENDFNFNFDIQPNEDMVQHVQMNLKQGGRRIDISNSVIENISVSNQ